MGGERIRRLEKMAVAVGLGISLGVAGYEFGKNVLTGNNVTTKDLTGTVVTGEPPKVNEPIPSSTPGAERINVGGENKGVEVPVTQSVQQMTHVNYLPAITNNKVQIGGMLILFSVIITYTLFKEKLQVLLTH